MRRFIKSWKKFAFDPMNRLDAISLDAELTDKGVRLDRISVFVCCLVCVLGSVSGLFIMYIRVLISHTTLTV